MSDNKTKNLSFFWQLHSQCRHINSPYTFPYISYIVTVSCENLVINQSNPQSNPLVDDYLYSRSCPLEIVLILYRKVVSRSTWPLQAPHEFSWLLIYDPVPPRLYRQLPEWYLLQKTIWINRTKCWEARKMKSHPRKTAIRVRRNFPPTPSTLTRTSSNSTSKSGLCKVWTGWRRMADGG